jgi:hypothetical protein
MVPEAQDSVSHTFQPDGSPGIVRHLIGVLSAIGLDNQFGFETYKIDNIRLNNHLASKFITLHSMPPQVFP